VAALAELYLDPEDPKGGRSWRPNKKESTWKVDEQTLRQHIVPVLGNKPVAAITPEDVEELQAVIARIRPCPTRPQRTAGGKGAAVRTLAVLSTLMSFAIKKKLRHDNPCRGVERFRLPKRKPMLTINQLGALGDALAVAEADPYVSPWAIAAIKLLLHTGARRGEILSLRWEDVDLESGVAHLIDSKTGPKDLELSDVAIEVLKSLPRTSSPYVLPSVSGDGHFVNVYKTWDRIRRAAGLGKVRVHDMRHNFATHAVAEGHSLFLTGKVLGHSRAESTERYSHVARSPIHAVAESTSSRIALGLKSGKVVKLGG
jgi:integrase